MLFNQPAFPVFLAAVIVLDRLVPARARNAALLACSWAFYGCWNWRYVPLLIACSSIDFVGGLALQRLVDPRARLRALWLTVGANLAILAWFKLGLSRVALPVGISFYTFQSMSYSIDVYRRRIRACESWARYSLFVSFFPHLVAGPIQRAEALLPQLRPERRTSAADVDEGLALLFVGYVKKMLLADGVAPFVDQCFAGWASAPSGKLALGALLFSLQIYWDFSGYTDIARGAARLLGVDFTLNFAQPYLATDIRDLWRRWHISVSTWLRDYVYIPLGGSRGGMAQWTAALFVTMLLGGLWHGVGWTFVVWGLLHFVFLAGHRLLTGPPRPEPRPRLSPWGFAWRCALTNLCWSLALIPFRSPDLRSAWGYVSRLVVWRGPVTVQELGLAALAVGAWLAVDLPMYLTGTQTALRGAPPWLRQAVVAAGSAAIVVALLTQGAERPFIYFQF